MYDTERVLNEFGVHPRNYVMYRSFTGDKSDNIPGVSGIGPKTLLKHVPNLNQEQEYELNKLNKIKANIYYNLFISLIKILNSLPLFFIYLHFYYILF